MKIKKMLPRSLLLLGAAAGLAAATESHEKHHQEWLYGDVNGRGPSNWRDLEGNEDCKKNEQSPINIHGAAVDRELRPLEMHYSEAVGFTLTNSQHSVKLVPKNGEGNYLLDRNNGGKRYNLAQMHFHSPSEHGIGGGLFDLEMHLVHTLAEEDANEKYQYLVVGVLFRAGNTPNELLNFFSDLPSVPLADFENYGSASVSYEVTEVTSNSVFDFGALLAGEGFYKYPGSFTTPPCTEGVAWHVMHDVNVVSGAQLEAFRTAMGFERELEVAQHAGLVTGPFKYFGNNRPVMPLGDREVSQYTGSEDYDETQIKRLMLVMIVVGTVALIVGCVGVILGCSTITITEEVTYAAEKQITGDNPPDEEAPKVETKKE